MEQRGTIDRDIGPLLRSASPVMQFVTISHFVHINGDTEYFIPLSSPLLHWVSYAQFMQRNRYLLPIFNRSLVVLRGLVSLFNQSHDVVQLLTLIKPQNHVSVAP